MQDFWTQTRERIRTNVDVRTWDQFFCHLDLVESESHDDRVVLELPDAFFVTWFENNYRDYLADTVGEVLGRTVEVSFVERLIPPEPSEEIDATPELALVTAIASLEARVETIGLNPRYTFDNFVVGPSNQFCYAASHAVAERPAQAYNPLFLYGGVGLGKTHLLHAIGIELLRDRPDLRVTYVTSESFMNALIHSLRTRDTNSFRTRFRDECDVLLMDDIQFIAGKDATQEEFFHTFNALHQAHKQIVITSDKPPHELPGLEERLRSRFGWGLIADIQPPAMETRVAIIKKKAEELEVEIDDNVALFLGTQIRSNVREIEGSLVRLKAYASLFGRPITLDVTRNQLKGLLGEGRSRVTIAAIQKLVANYFNVKIADLTGPRRFRAIAHPRHVAMYLARQHTESSFPEIGRQFGNRDHTTVMNAVSKIEARCRQDESLKRQVQALEQSLLTS